MGGGINIKKTTGLSFGVFLIEVNQKQCFCVSQLLPGWVGLCSSQTPLRFLMNHSDTVTWDLSSRSVVTVNYSRREGSVWETVALHWHRPDLITRLQKNTNSVAMWVCLCSSFWWTEIVQREYENICVHRVTSCGGTSLSLHAFLRKFKYFKGR